MGVDGTCEWGSNASVSLNPGFPHSLLVGESRIIADFPPRHILFREPSRMTDGLAAVIPK